MDGLKKYLLLWFCLWAALLAPSLSFAITEGQDAVVGRWPFMVALVQSDKIPETGLICAATLIAPDWLLTAAHCVNGLNPENIDAVIGLHALNQTSGSDRFSIQSIIVHPDNNALSLSADVALLKLSRSSNQATLTAPAIYAGPSSLSAYSADFIGWGFNQINGADQNILQQASTGIVHNSTCQTAYSVSLTIQDNMVCAGDGDNGPSLCTHDSGGPLMVEIKGQEVLVGVASFSLACGVAGYSGFAYLPALKTFLQANVPEVKFVNQEQLTIMPPILMLLL